MTVSTLIVMVISAVAMIMLDRRLPSNRSSATWGFAPVDYSALVVIAACYALLVWPILLRLPEDSRLLQALSPDFANQVHLVRAMVEARALDLGIPRDIAVDDTAIPAWRWGYGAAHINLSILSNLAASLFTPLTFRSVALVHSGILSLAFIATGWLIYVLGCRIHGRALGLVGAAIYALPYKILHVSVHACFPDHIQQALLVAAILVIAGIAQGGGARWTGRAGALAGLAIGTKYLGIVLIPLIAVFAFWAASRRGWVKMVGLSAFAAAAQTVMGFALASPQAVAMPRYFIDSLHAFSKLLNYSWYFRDGVFVTYVRAFRETFLAHDAALWALVVGGTIVLAWLSWRRRSAEGAAALGWLASYAIFLLLVSRYIEAGVFLPIWPVLALAAAAGGLAPGLAATALLHRFQPGIARRALVVTLPGLALLGWHELSDEHAAARSVRGDRPLLYAIDHPFYDGVRQLASYLRTLPEDTAVLVDYSMIYIPEHLPTMISSFYPRVAEDLARWRAANLERPVDILILSHRDEDFAADLDQYPFDRDKVIASRELYRRIRGGGDYVKIGQFDYPPGWTTMPVEIWRRRR